MSNDDAMNPEDLRNDSCTMCKLHKDTDYVCEMGTGVLGEHRIMVVGKMPNSAYFQRQLEEYLEEAGIYENVYTTAALKCKNFDANASNLDVKTCRQYLEAEIAMLEPKWVLTLGNEALLATTGHSGIMSWRGRVIEKQTAGHNYKVFPTISPSSVTRNPGQRQGFLADLLLFNSMTQDRANTIPTPKMFIVDTQHKVKQLAELLDKAELLSYDIETRSDNRMEQDPLGVIVSLSGTMMFPEGSRLDREREGHPLVWALPLRHPESVWSSKWRSLLKYLAPHLERVPKQIAHNGKFDSRWLRKFGVRSKVTFDTMIAAHLLDENRQKGLKPQAASRLGVPPWALDTRDLWQKPIREVLKYNALDTFYTYHIYLQIKEELLEQPRLARIFTKILMPANEHLTESELLGVFLDQERLATRGKIARDTLAGIDAELMQWVPEEIPTLSKARKPRPTQINFNPSNFARWLLFEHLELPVVARGKPKPDGGPGDPSMAEAVLLELKGSHPIVEKLLERVTWNKYVTSFFGAYEELVDENSRVHTSFKLTGTVTGRLSSGKVETDKITARGRTRGINLQQVPRNAFIRGLFGVPSGYTFVEVDFSQVELRVVAFLSRDKTMLRLYQTGQDIHMATAMWVLGKPQSQISKEDRKKAKAVNFGFVYSMGAAKFVTTAFENYELRFTLDEAKAIRREYFNRFRGLLAWHARMRRLVHQHGRVQSPLGRIRRLPDIYSEDSGVQAEAERQAINSPVQSFASDMNTLGMVEAVKNLKHLDCKVLGLVHDATLWEVKTEHLREALPIIKRTYENLPLDKKFGVHLDVPMVADIKVGTHWGDAEEISEQEVYNWQRK